MLSDGKWTRICDSSLLTSKLQLRGKMGRKKEKNIALNPSKSGKTLSWVYQTSERVERGFDTKGDRDADKDKRGDGEKEFDFRVSRCPFSLLQIN